MQGIPTTCRLLLLAPALVVLLWTISACASTPDLDGSPSILASAQPGPSWERLTPGDVLRITVYGHPEMSTGESGERVDPNGILHLPLLDSIVVLGLTVEEVKIAVADAASAFVRDPSVGISVVSFGARDFYVLGHIDGPGPYRIDRPLTASQALSLGGKILPGAARSSIYLLRPGPDGFAYLEFDANEPSEAWLVPVQPNDVIFVPRGRSGHFAEEILPYLQGVGFLSTVPFAFKQLTT